MKSTIVSLALVIVIVCCVLLAAFGLVSYLEDARTEKVVQFLSDYSKNEDLAFIGDRRVYLHDKTISRDQIKDFSVEDFLFVSDDTIYFYTVGEDRKTVEVHCVDFNLNYIKKIFTKTHEARDPYLSMVDERYIYIHRDADYRYDMETEAFELLGEQGISVWEDACSRDAYSVLNVENGVWDRSAEYTVARKSDGMTKNIGRDSLLKNDLAKKLHDIQKIQVIDIAFQGNDVYIVCSCQWNVVVVFRYDFETEEVSFFGWRNVIDTEGLQTIV